MFKVPARAYRLQNNIKLFFNFNNVRIAVSLEKLGNANRLSVSNKLIALIGGVLAIYTFYICWAINIICCSNVRG